MAKIHNVEVYDEKHYELDPVRGAVLKSEQVLKPGGAQVINHDDVEYEVSADGSFDVPDEVAELLLKQPGWFSGASPFQEAPEVERKNAAKPRSRKTATT